MVPGAARSAAAHRFLRFAMGCLLAENAGIAARPNNGFKRCLHEYDGCEP